MLVQWITAHWSYVLAPFGLAGMIMAGRKNRWGWMLSIFTQVLWVTYALNTAQYGFIIGSVSYGAVYLKNFLGWGKKPMLMNVDVIVDDLLPGDIFVSSTDGRHITVRRAYT